MTRNEELERREERQRLRRERAAYWALLSRSGCSLDAIAAAFGVTRGTVLYAVSPRRRSKLRAAYLARASRADGWAARSKGPWAAL